MLIIEMLDVPFIKKLPEKLWLFIIIDFLFLIFYCVYQKKVVILCADNIETWCYGEKSI